MRMPMRAEECAANAASIAEIPPEQLPNAEVRAELVRRALVGCDVSAYRLAFQPEYVVWVRQSHPSIEARFAPMDWAEQWRAGLQPTWPAQRDEGVE